MSGYPLDQALRVWEYAGLKCVIADTEVGHINGYVQVPRNHVAFGVTYDRVGVNVHGGLTYGDGDGWFGFDTAHGQDLWTTADLIRAGVDETKAANSQRYRRISGGVHHWTADALIAEVESLAEQLAALTELPEPDAWQITDDELTALRAERDALRAEVAALNANGVAR